MPAFRGIRGRYSLQVLNYWKGNPAHTNTRAWYIHQIQTIRAVTMGGTNHVIAVFPGRSAIKVEVFCQHKGPIQVLKVFLCVGLHGQLNKQRVRGPRGEGYVCCWPSRTTPGHFACVQQHLLIEINPSRIPKLKHERKHISECLFYSTLPGPKL